MFILYFSCHDVNEAWHHHWKRNMNRLLPPYLHMEILHCVCMLLHTLICACAYIFLLRNYFAYTLGKGKYFRAKNYLPKWNRFILLWRIRSSKKVTTYKPYSYMEFLNLSGFIYVRYQRSWWFGPFTISIFCHIQSTYLDTYHTNNSFLHSCNIP